MSTPAIITAQSIDILQSSRELFSQILSTNATYLTISVSIILGSNLLLSVAMYFFNFKPIKDGLDEQEEKIENIKNETQKKVEDLKMAQMEVSNSINNLREENKNILANLKSVSDEEVLNIKKLFDDNQKSFNENVKSEIRLRIDEINLKISDIEKAAIEKALLLEGKNRSLDIQTTWNMHYTWEAQGVPVNSFSSIVATLEKALEALKISNNYESYIGLCLQVLPKTIDNVIASSPKIFISLPETINKLDVCISLIKGHDVEIGEVKIKIKSLREVLI